MGVREGEATSFEKIDGFTPNLMSSGRTADEKLVQGGIAVETFVPAKTNGNRSRAQVQGKIKT